MLISNIKKGLNEPIRIAINPAEEMFYVLSGRHTKTTSLTFLTTELNELLGIPLKKIILPIQRNLYNPQAYTLSSSQFSL